MRLDNILEMYIQLLKNFNANTQHKSGKLVLQGNMEPDPNPMSRGETDQIFESFHPNNRILYPTSHEKIGKFISNTDIFL
jgi:hypothetical protein